MVYKVSHRWIFIHTQWEIALQKTLVYKILQINSYYERRDTQNENLIKKTFYTEY